MRGELRAQAVGERARHELVVGQGVAVAHEAEPRGERAEQLVVGARLAWWRRDGRAVVHPHHAVAAAQVAVLEERGGRQHHVGELGGVGHHLLVDDHEQIVARQLLDHGALVRGGRGRVAVVDEERLDPWRAQGAQRGRQLAHVDDARAGRRRGDRRLRAGVPRDVAVRHRVAAAAHAELAGDRREREDRGDRAAAVAVALRAVAAADRGRDAGGIELDERVARARRPEPRGVRGTHDRRGRARTARGGSRARPAGPCPAAARGADRRCAQAASRADRSPRASRRSRVPW